MTPDEEKIATTMADAAGQSGLRKYVWLYFLIVPLAATTASVVAVTIAALQGLSAHDLSSRLYALIVLLASKSLMCIAGAYLLSLALATASTWLFSRHIEKMANYLRSIKRAKKEHFLYTKEEYNPLKHEESNYTKRIEKYNALKNATLGFSLMYGLCAFVAGLYIYVLDDFSEVSSILQRIASVDAAAAVEPGRASTIHTAE